VAQYCFAMMPPADSHTWFSLAYPYQT